jgi:hypothetical protein
MIDLQKPLQNHEIDTGLILRNWWQLMRYRQGSMEV